MSDDREAVTRVVAKLVPTKPDPYPGLRCAHRMILLARQQEEVASGMWIHRATDDDSEERGLFARHALLEDFRKRLERDFIDEVATTLGWPTSLEVSP